MSTPPRVLGIFPQLEGHGGVQRFCRHLAMATNGYTEVRGGSFTALTLKGLNGSAPVPHKGFNGSRLRLALHTFIASTKVDLIVVGHPFLAPLAIACKRIRPRLRVMVHAHGIDVWTPLTPKRRQSLAVADVITCSSSYTLETMKRVQQLTPIRSEVLYPALEPNWLLEPTPAHTARERFFLFVGRLSAEDRGKGFWETLEAFRQLASSDPQFRLVFVGTGSELAAMRAKCAEWGLTERVDFLGGISDADLRQLFKRSLAFVMPSGKEGFGIVYTEAMAMGAPVIAGNGGGAPEIVLQGQTGILVQPGDVASLTVAMGKLATDASLCERLGKAGQERVRTAFQFDRFNAQVAALLDTLSY